MGALLVFLFSLGVTLAGSTDYGFTWDETETNFPAARRQAEWFQLFFSKAVEFSEASIREFFYTESDHPSLPRTWMALSRLVLPSSIPDRIAFGFSTALQFSAFLALFFAAAARRYGWIPGLTATALLLFHPRLLAHSHIAEYDLPIMVWWFFAALAFYAAASRTPGEGEARSRDWFNQVGAAAVLGMALSVKLHAFFLPFPLLAWAAITRRLRVCKWVIACAFIAPLLYVATQPYLWWDTLDRIQARFIDYSGKWPITVYYLGEMHQGDLPWHYPWVLIAATTPIGTALLAVLGAGAAFRRMESGTEERSWVVFSVLNFLVIPVLFSWKSPYDGIRLFLVAIPFLGVFAAKGVAWLRDSLCPSESCSVRRSQGLLTLLCFLVIGGQAWTCYRIHPYGLAYYSGAVGGVRGAQSLGFETTYWCDAFTPDFIRELASVLPSDAVIATHSCDASTFIEFQKAGIAPQGWTFRKEGVVQARVIQYRQGFFGPVEIRLIADREPLVIRSLEGVPLVAAYAGP